MRKLTPAMQRAVEILERNGYVDTGDGVTVNTTVALMKRGIIREAHRYGLRHYPETTPEQVHAEAEAINARTICVGDTVERVHERGPAHPHGKVVRFSDLGLVALVSFNGMSPVWITVDSLRRDVPSWDEMGKLYDAAVIEDDERSGGWGQPEGMLAPEDTRGQYFSDEKLRGLLVRYGHYTPRMPRDEMLACLRANNLIERTWEESIDARQQQEPRSCR